MVLQFKILVQYVFVTLKKCLKYFKQYKKWLYYNNIILCLVSGMPIID